LGILSPHLKGSLAATGGVHGVVDGIKAILSGAHAVQMVSAVLQQGPQRVREMEQGLRAWMVRHHYDSLEAFRGGLNQRHFGPPGEAERARLRSGAAHLVGCGRLKRRAPSPPLAGLAPPPTPSAPPRRRRSG
jgi:hypothetical protein